MDQSATPKEGEEDHAQKNEKKKQFLLNECTLSCISCIVKQTSGSSLRLDQISSDMFFDL